MVAKAEVLPVPASAKELDFGARVTGIDLANPSDNDFAVLERAVYERLVVVVPGQGHLTARDQLALTQRFDPSAGEYGHGSDQALMAASVLQNDLHAIPSAPEVKLLGNGVVASHDEGRMRDVPLRHPMHYSFHKETLPPEDADRATRFFRWHIDAAFYARQPPRVTTLLALEVPVRAGTQTVRYDDGSGDQLDVPLAATAFISGEQAFEALVPEAKAFALAASVRYHPHPYIWMKEAKALSTGRCEGVGGGGGGALGPPAVSPSLLGWSGLAYSCTHLMSLVRFAPPAGLGIVSEGKELPASALPPWKEELVCSLPAVWKNPVTGKLALQIHPCSVEDVFVGGQSLSAQAGGGQEGLARVRRVLDALVRPGIAPPRVLAHNWAPGDLVIFNNRAVLHTVTGTLAPDDRRVFHQCNLAGSDAPVAPGEDEVAVVLAQEGIRSLDAGVSAFLKAHQ